VSWIGRLRDRRITALQMRAVAASPLFDGAWYLARYPDVVAAGIDPVEHYVRAGAAEGRSPGPEFDAGWYLRVNPDVAASRTNPLLHYLQRGRADGCVPTPHDAALRAVAASPLFDSTWYLSRYPDVATAGIDPVEHYVRAGAAEGRSPGPEFEAGWYLRVNPDVAASGMNPLLHYLERGRAEGREPTPHEAPNRAIAASPLFDAAWYLMRYPDVTAAGVDPVRHYVRAGAAEGRSPGPEFDGEWYLRVNPDVAASGANPLLHYLERGRAEGRKARKVPSDALYADWVREHDTLDESDRIAIRTQVDELPSQPLISVVVPVYDTEEHHLTEMIESVRHQIYTNWELCIADDASSRPHVRRVLEKARLQDPRIKVVYRSDNGHISAASNSACELATGEFVALLDHDDVLPVHALSMVAHAINQHPDSDLFYSDEDKLDAAGRRHDPYFKPEWDEELICCQNFVSHLGVYRRSVMQRVGLFRPGFEGSQDYDLALRVANATRGPIVHIPHVLYHWRRFHGSRTYSSTKLDRASDAARRAIADYLAARGEEVTVVAGAASYHRVIRRDPDVWPLVSVIVPTRDRVDLLGRCVRGLLEGTDYPNLEIIIADNDSCETETHAFFAEVRQRGVRIVACPGEFNFSRINNRASQESSGSILLFLNNDIAMTHTSWLKEMIHHAVRPGVGAVGARLLYPDGRIQHAGVLLGFMGAAGHMYRGAAGDDLGYQARLKLSQCVSCVTGACMAVPRTVFDSVGGFDENLPVDFNDVDLCIKMRRAGYRIIWTPYAELYHAESSSRGPAVLRLQVDANRQAADYIQRRWGAELGGDPCSNPNLSRDSLRPELAFPPAIVKPWLAVKEKPPLGRAEMLLATLDRSARIIEIGASYSPIAPRAGGWNTTTLDHGTRAQLVEKYRGQPDVDVDRIEEVGFVWTSGPMVDAVPAHLHGTFDAFIASHVIEHTTDLVGFLAAAATLLSETGVVILAVPDKRYCFDYFRPLTTTGAILAAHAPRRSRHTRQIVFDQRPYAVRNDGAGAWGQSPVGDIQFFQSLEDAAAECSSASEDPDSPYLDMHAWQFSPASFELILLELARLGLTDWLIERITPTMGCEFHVWLRRGGMAGAATLTQDQLNARRLELLKRTLQQAGEQVDFLLAGVAMRDDPSSAAGIR